MISTLQTDTNFDEIASIEQSKELNVIAYDTLTFKKEGYFNQPKSQVFCVRFDPEEKYIAAGFTDLSIRIYNLFSGKVSYILKTSMPTDEKVPVTSIRWRPSGSGLKTQNVLTSSYADGTIIHWHVTSGKVLHTFRTGQPLYCLDYNSSGQLFAAGGKDPAIGIYDQPTKSLKLTLKQANRDRPGHTNRVFSVKFDDQQPHILASGGWDKILNIWDLRTGKVQQQLLGPYICGDALDIKANKLMTGSYRTSDVIQIYDRRKLQKETSINWNRPEEQQTGRVYSCKFNRQPMFKHQFILAAGAYHNEVKLFDASVPEYPLLASIQGLPKSILDSDVSPKTNMVAFGGADGSVQIMKIGKVEEQKQNSIFSSEEEAQSPLDGGMTESEQNFQESEISSVGGSNYNQLDV